MGIKNQKIVLLILLILVAAAGYSAWKFFSKPEPLFPPEEPTEEPTTEPTTSEPTTQPELEEITPSPDIDTSDWKTYRNEEYGFEIEYPQNGEVEEVAGTYLLFYFDIHLNRSKVVLLIKQNENQVTLRDFILKPYRDGCVISFAGECDPNSEANKAAAKEAEESIKRFQTEHISGLRIGDNYYFQKDKLVYIIFMPVQQTKEDIGMLEKIVATFRFLE